MFWTESKLKKRIEDIKEFIYSEKIEILNFLGKEDNLKEINPSPLGLSELNENYSIGDIWKGRDRYLWLGFSVDIPKEWKDSRTFGYFDFGKTGPGTNSGFESLLYINKEECQGVDTNHKEINITGYNGKTEFIFRLWSGLEGGGVLKEQTHLFKKAFIGKVHEETYEFYNRGRVICDSLPYIDDLVEKNRLIEILNRAIIKIDWSFYDGDKFYESIKLANSFLKEELGKLDRKAGYNIWAIGHTHIDYAWLWRTKHTREKAIRSFNTVLRLMDEFPHYKFLQTMPQIYEELKKDNPKLYEKIVERIKEGRWEAGGGMWVEADTNIPSGESLIRQILLANKFFKKEFGVKQEYLWLPDTFGYSANLPQILKKSGINKLITTKISWNQYNRIPNDTFNWKGIDGSEILTHFITTPNMGQKEFDAGELIHYTYNGVIHPKTVTGIWKTYNNKEINRDLLLSYGYGDGGGGVNRQMLEDIVLLDSLPAMPTIKTKRVDDYLKNLEEVVNKEDKFLPSWVGELYLEFHRGTYTTLADMKKYNRNLENLYRELEILSSINYIENKKYFQDELEKGWKLILKNQFHDIIPGTSIREVYEDTAKEYEKAYEINREIRKNLENITEKDCYTVFNPHKISRKVEVFIPEERDGIFSNDGILESQKVKGGHLVLAQLKEYSYNNFLFEEKKSKSKTFIKIDDEKIETPYYEIRLNKVGQLISIYDKENSREVLKGRGNLFEILDDRPLTPDAWEIESYYYRKEFNRVDEVNNLTSMRIKENSNLRAVIELSWKYGKTIIKQDMILYTNNRRIDFKTTVDWQERKKFLKVGFEVDIHTTKATYDIQNGNIERANHWNTDWDLAKFEVCGHRWADLSERGYGVTLLNDSKYGWDIKENRMRLSLLRGATDVYPESDLKIHNFTFSLLPHRGDFIEGRIEEEAIILNRNFKARLGKEIEKSYFKLDRENIVIDAIKKAEEEEALIIRVHEFSGKRERVYLKTLFGIDRWCEINLLEENIDDYKKEELKFEIKPYEIKTFKLVLKN